MKLPSTEFVAWQILCEAAIRAGDGSHKSLMFSQFIYVDARKCNLL